MVKTNKTKALSNLEKTFRFSFYDLILMQREFEKDFGVKKCSMTVIFMK
jgi:hypothetical protein